MLTAVNPKLPMRDKEITRNYYLDKLDFQELGSTDFEGYLMIKKEHVEIHFFEFKDLDPKENYGQIYIRTNNIDLLYERMLAQKVEIHPNGSLQMKPWGQKEFSLLDPDHNLLTFGQELGK